MDFSARHGSGGIAPMHLIGREAETERLRLLVRQVATGAGDALLLSGDPGVEKTSPLDFAADLAVDSGIRVLRATGSQFEAGISYAALHQLVYPCLALVPELSPPLAGALNVALGLGDGPPPARLLVATAVLALAQQAAKEQPLLLIIDDLPWLDRAFDLARIQLAYGSALRRVKRTTDARQQLAGAAEIFRRLGAVPWAARADRELRATGITIAKADAGLASLTPQQRQIALLAAAGHTNKEIAARLFLSPRTVSTHLYQVFPKLGITSRAALRDALADTPPE